MAYGPKPTPLPPVAPGKSVRFGDALRDLRRRRQVTQRELASATGLTFVQICGIENGRHTATEEQLCTISYVLDVPADLLILASQANPK